MNTPLSTIVTYTSITFSEYRCLTPLTSSPKIQPIADPNPEVLTARHRMFSPETGHWHEVVGDAAAMEILGEDAFKHGPKESRHIRKPFHEVSDAERYAGTAKQVQTDVSNITAGDTDALSGTGRVIEREYRVGQEEPEWKVVPRGTLFNFASPNTIGQAM